MTARPPYRPGQRTANAAQFTAAQALADAVVAFLRGYEARIAQWDGGVSKGYHVFPAVSGSTTPTVAIRYVPAPAATFDRVYGKARNRALDRVSHEALRDAYLLLHQAGWAVELVDDTPGQDKYTPHILVTAKGQ